MMTTTGYDRRGLMDRIKRFASALELRRIEPRSFDTNRGIAALDLVCRGELKDG